MTGARTVARVWSGVVFKEQQESLRDRDSCKMVATDVLVTLPAVRMSSNILLFCLD